MKNCLLIFSILLSSICASAQKLTVIPKIGTTLATVLVEEPDFQNLPILGDQDANSVKPIFGITIGAAFNYSINDMISVQPELNFIQKGYQEKFYSSMIEIIDDKSFNTHITSTSKYKMNYLEIPILARYTFGTTIKPYAIAGPSLGIGLGGKYKFEEKIVESIDDDPAQTSTDNGKGNIKFGKEPDNNDSEDLYIDNRIDFGLQLGAGVLIDRKFVIEARYGLGLSSLSDSEYKIKNRVFQLTVGIPILLK